VSALNIEVAQQHVYPLSIIADGFGLMVSANDFIAKSFQRSDYARQIQLIYLKGKSELDAIKRIFFHNTAENFCMIFLNETTYF
jgi:hypothetical protein